MPHDFTPLLARLSLDPRFSGISRRAIKLVIDGEAVILIPGSPPEMKRGNGRAACTIEMSSHTFAEIAAGRKNPQELCARGEIKVKGDTDQALWCAELIRGS